MRQEFSDRSSLLHAMAAVREATFHGREIAHDEASRTVTLTVTRAENPGQPGSRFFRKRASFLRTAITVRHVTGYQLSLAGEPEDIYILDRVELGRGGQEIALYFRPGDRAVIDVDQITGSVEDVGKATSSPRRPVIRNPLAAEERESHHPPAGSRRVFGGSGKKRG